MKHYPKGTKFASVPLTSLVSTFDVMEAQGNEDREKMEQLKQACDADKYVKEAKQALKRAEIATICGVERLALDLPYGFAFPPAVASPRKEEYEILDGRSFVELCRQLEWDSLVVAVTPVTSRAEAIKEAAIGNLPANGIKRSQMTKPDVQKTVNQLFHQEGLNRQDIKNLLGPLFETQKVQLNQCLAEVHSTEQNKRTVAAAELVVVSKISYADAAKTLSKDGRITVTAKAVENAVKDKMRGRTKEEAFSKTVGRSVIKGLDTAYSNVGSMEILLNRYILAGKIDYKECVDGLSGLIKRFEQTHNRVVKVKDRFESAHSKP